MHHCCLRQERNLSFTLVHCPLPSSSRTSQYNSPLIVSVGFPQINFLRSFTLFALAIAISQLK